MRTLKISQNLLHYSQKIYYNQTPQIGAEHRNIEGKEYNSIYVHDTGPSIQTTIIEPAIIDKLFESFYTSGKVGGTGLGLSFC